MSMTRRRLMQKASTTSDILYHVENVGVVSTAFDTGVDLLSEDKDFTVCLDILLSANGVSDMLQHSAGADYFCMSHYSNFFYARHCRTGAAGQCTLYDADTNLIGNRKQIVARHEAGSGKMYVWSDGLSETETFSISTYTAVSGSLVFKKSTKCTLYDLTIYNRYITDAEVDAYFARDNA